MNVSADKIQSLIEEAEQAGVPDEELQELREHLANLKSASGTMTRKAKTEPMYQEFIRDGKRIVLVSTAPTSSNDDFDGLNFRPVKPV